MRECLIGFSLLLLFMFWGRRFLAALHLSEVSLGISGGIILFLIALRMIFPSPGPQNSTAEGSNVEPFLFPLAIPYIAGPSALATVLLLVSRNPDQILTLIAALTTAMGASCIIFLASWQLAKLLGSRVMTAMEHLMGLILTAVAVEMFLQGVRTFIQSLHNP
jgi:small neutral amino acid transporter SnatA (MarC family)